MLTADADDRFFGTNNSDTFNAEAGTLQTGDRILDSSTDDNDTLNAVINGSNTNNAPEVVNVENINLDLDVFSGAVYDATNTEGATITGASDKLGFNGSFQVTAAGDNNVVAGENVTDLTVTDLGAGNVDAGAAETVTIDTVAFDAETTEVTNNVTVNGDVELSVTANDNAADDKFTLNLTSTAAAVVSLTAFNSATIAAGGSLTITGDEGITLATDADEIYSATADVNLSGFMLDVNAATGGDLDAENFDLAGFEVSTDDTLAITNAQGQEINLTAEDAGLTVSGAGEDGDSVVVNVSANQAANTALVVNSVDSSTINLTADVEEIASLTVAGDATLNVAGDVTIAALVATAATDTLAVAGEGDVTITGSTLSLESIDASGLTGNLEFNQGVDANIDVVAGEGDDEITLAGTTGTEASVVTGNGDNTVDATALTDGTLAVTGGVGEDTLELGAIAFNVGATVAVDFGDGNDTLDIAATANFVGNNLNLENLENIVLNGAGATMAASQVTEQEYNVRGEGFGTSTLTVELAAGGDSVDLSGLDVSDSATTGVEFSIDGGTGNDTIVGTSIDDTITGGTGVDTMTGGAGADTFVIAAGDTGITAATADTITDFETGVDAIDTQALDSVASADGSGYADFAAFVAAAETSFEGTLADGFVAYDAAGSGDAWVAIDETGDGVFGAGDSLVILTGIDQASEIATTDIA